MNCLSWPTQQKVENPENWKKLLDHLIKLRDRKRDSEFRMDSFIIVDNDEGMVEMGVSNLHSLLCFINDLRPCDQKVTYYDLIEVGPRVQIDDHDCGTAACLLGWAHILSGNQSDDNRASSDWAWAEGLKFLGLHADTPAAEFVPYGYWVTDRQTLSEITIDQAIEYLAKVLATDNVFSMIDAGSKS